MPAGVIWAHGYKREYGRHTSPCPGAQFPPYEQSCDRLRQIIEEVKKIIVNEQKSLENLKKNPPEIIVVYEHRGSWSQEEKKEYQKPEDFNPNDYYKYSPRTYEYAYDSRKNKHEQTIRMATSDLAYMEQRLNDWKLVDSQV